MQVQFPTIFQRINCSYRHVKTHESNNAKWRDSARGRGQFQRCSQGKGTSQKNIFHYRGLEVGWKALKGESLDFSTMLAIYLSLALQVWIQWFFHNPKSAGDNLNSNLFWGKESRRMDVGSSMKKIHQRKSFCSWNGQSLIFKFAFISRNAWCAMKIFSQSQWNPNGGFIPLWLVVEVEHFPLKDGPKDEASTMCDCAIGKGEQKTWPTWLHGKIHTFVKLNLKPTNECQRKCGTFMTQKRNHGCQGT